MALARAYQARPSALATMRECKLECWGTCPGAPTSMRLRARLTAKSISELARRQVGLSTSRKDGRRRLPRRWVAPQVAVSPSEARTVANGRAMPLHGSSEMKMGARMVCPPVPKRPEKDPATRPMHDDAKNEVIYSPVVLWPRSPADRLSRVFRPSGSECVRAGNRRSARCRAASGSAWPPRWPPS